MELEQREGTMAAVGFEEFSAPPGSELALPPLFGGHILESELETEVEFVSGGLGGSGLRERDEEEEAARGRRRRQRELNRRKYQALGRRCREIEQVNERVLNRLHQVQRITRRLQQERRFLMRVLDSYGDDYRASQFTIVLEDEGSQGTDAPTPGNAENEPPEKEALSPPRRTPAPPEPGSPAPGEGPSGRKRRRVPRDGRRAGTVLTPELASVQVRKWGDSRGGTGAPELALVQVRRGGLTGGAGARAGAESGSGLLGFGFAP
ncbi:PREDICTED: TCF3 fusion partner isoform X1 [Rhinopithecus bieti]|uniref:TCF3 fusion partner n=1 Tax=Rhinopithecus roxellana TaxID=61622 RepID=A0A2K6QYY4_RHIRO|nr:PREDICTED: TCF3 fusion partner isoform X1 [Rhinopithecus bieti]